jgi:pimeloyl-ACP methyl ester carboxylesterase
MRTRVLDVAGPAHVADFGGSGPPMILVHGLGGSHLNWTRVGPLLAERARVLAPDLPGFGRTRPAGRSTGVLANSRFLGRFVREVAGGPAIVVGNSMGGLIGILAAANHPAEVAGLVLLDPALPLAPGAPRDRQVMTVFSAYMVPGIGELFVRRRLAARGAEGLVRDTFELSCVDPSRVPQEVVDAHVQMVRERTRMPWANQSVLRAARSLVRVILRRRRFRDLLATIEAPTLLLQGEADRLVQLASARIVSRVRPDWTFRTLPDVGHIPHLEDPEATVREIWRWLDGPGRGAWEAAATRAGESV